MCDVVSHLVSEPMLRARDKHCHKACTALMGGKTWLCQSSVLSMKEKQTWLRVLGHEGSWGMAEPGLGRWCEGCSAWVVCSFIAGCQKRWCRVEYFPCIETTNEGNCTVVSLYAHSLASKCMGHTILAAPMSPRDAI